MENGTFNKLKVDETNSDEGRRVSSQVVRDEVTSNIHDMENSEMDLNRMPDQSHEGSSKRGFPARKRGFFSHPKTIPCDHIPKNYSYIFRLKSQWELILLSGTICGIEFCYTAETAYVTPILLSLGLNIKFVTMIWCLSPLVGFFLTPVLGSLSDTCESRFGRRRPYVLLLGVGIVLGLILVPNGQRIGASLGDKGNSLTGPHIDNNFQGYNDSLNKAYEEELSNFSETVGADSREADFAIMSSNLSLTIKAMHLYNVQNNGHIDAFISGKIGERNSRASLKFSSSSSLRRERFTLDAAANNTKTSPSDYLTRPRLQTWSLVFTVIGTVLLDTCADASQFPSRAYLLDVCVPDDHVSGISTITFMAGFGGTIGYLMGATHWEANQWAKLLGGQVHVVFMISIIVFVFFLTATICSFPEMPLRVLRDPKMRKEYNEKIQVRKFSKEITEILPIKQMSCGTENECSDKPIYNIMNEVHEVNEFKQNSTVLENDKRQDEIDLEAATPTEPTLNEYLKSIFVMPSSLRKLCFTYLVGRMALVCYTLYFSDFVGECVYGGNSQAPEDSESYIIYKGGVRFACWGMALFSSSCSVYSYFIEALVRRFGAKKVYVGGQVAYLVGMIVMAASKHPAAVILLSPTAGIMYSSQLTIPYVLLSRYHSKKFHDDKANGVSGVRGMGTDVAIVSCMVFLSQFILSLTMGSVVEVVGSSVATIYSAAFLSAVAAILATQIVYYDA